MYKTRIETAAFRTLLIICLKIDIEKKMVVLRNVVNCSWANAQNLFASARKIVAVYLGIGDLLEVVAV